MSARVFLGNLPSRISERDVEDFFKKVGPLKSVVLKSGFGFVEFKDARDSQYAINDMNGRDLCGSRVSVERARSDPRRESGGGGRSFRNDDRGSFRSDDRGSFRPDDRGSFRSDDRGRRDNFRDGPRQPFRPNLTRFKLTVENLSSRCSWQDLKTMMKTIGWIKFVDAHKEKQNTGVVYFESHEDLKKAIDKYQGEDVNGRKIKLIDETRSSSRSRSRSLSPRRKRSASRSPRRSGSRSRSRSPRKKSLSRSPRRSRSRSHSPYRKRSANRSPRRSVSRSRSRSRSPSRKRQAMRSPRLSRSRSISPVRNRSPKRSVSPRRSRSPVVNGRADSRSPK